MRLVMHGLDMRLVRVPEVRVRLAMGSLDVHLVCI